MTDEEKAFGIVQRKTNTAILLRNWVTYLLRKCISQTERDAYHAPNMDIVKHVKTKFNNDLRSEIHIKAFRYKTEGNLDFFDKIITYSDILCKNRGDGEYEIRKVFT